MTNQETISILKTWRVTGDKEHEALDMAISALQEQEAKHSTTQKGLDTISRQAAIDAAIKADMENNSNVLSEKRARVIDRHISAVPSAQHEIVRCKDCIHWHRKNDLTYCDRIDYGYGYEPDDFCSRAERRNDEQN